MSELVCNCICGCRTTWSTDVLGDLCSVCLIRSQRGDCSHLSKTEERCAGYKDGLTLGFQQAMSRFVNLCAIAEINLNTIEELTSWVGVLKPDSGQSLREAVEAQISAAEDAAYERGLMAGFDATENIEKQAELVQQARAEALAAAADVLRRNAADPMAFPRQALLLGALKEVESLAQPGALEKHRTATERRVAEEYDSFATHSTGCSFDGEIPCDCGLHELRRRYGLGK